MLLITVLLSNVDDLVPLYVGSSLISTATVIFGLQGCSVQSGMLNAALYSLAHPRSFVFTTRQPSHRDFSALLLCRISNTTSDLGGLPL